VGAHGVPASPVQLRHFLARSRPHLAHGMGQRFQLAQHGHAGQSGAQQFIVLESLLSNPEWATQFSIHELVERTGTQGIELLDWLAMRAALTVGDGAGVRKVHSNYHIPISNTAAGLLALEKVN